MSLVHISGTATREPPAYHLIHGNPNVLYVARGSRLYALESNAEALDEQMLRDLGCDSPIEPGPPRWQAYPSAISLNIAQSCNLACSYCYADEGRFGAEPARMPLDIAIKATRNLLANAVSPRVSVGFIGGEPLLNRPVLHATVAFAAAEAERRGLKISFGITTNGTLVEERDLALFRSHRFAVTVSLDGPGVIHDALRPSRDGRGSFDTAVARMRPLLQSPGQAWVGARATITRKNLDIAAAIQALTQAGFRDIGVSPVRTGPDPELRLTDADWPILLAEMKTAADLEWQRVRLGGSFRFSNLAVALKQLHRGAHQQLPCGSAVSYVSVSASGDYYTCHRTVEQPALRLGNLSNGPSPDLRRQFIESRRVDRQEPCRSCWARYLCGGGCHAEVLSSGRAGCDYIRGWLEYCISLYPHVVTERPELLGSGPVLEHLGPLHE